MTSVQNESTGVSKGPVTADSRLKRSPDEARTDRAMEDRSITGDRELTDSTRAMSKRNEFNSNVLPNPPQIPGYKLIWLSTTHNADTIPERMRHGYEPVKLKDVPGFSDAWQIKSGEWAGYIGVREMLLFKIPVEMWAEDMNYVHHQAPLDEEMGIKESVRSLQNELDDGRSKVKVAPGIESLAAPVRKPKFV